MEHFFRLYVFVYPFLTQNLKKKSRSSFCSSCYFSFFFFVLMYFSVNQFSILEFSLKFFKLSRVNQIMPSILRQKPHHPFFKIFFYE